MNNLQAASRAPQAVEILLSDARGIYIPRDFCSDFDMSQWFDADGMKQHKDAWEICANCPDDDTSFYWEAWDEILNAAKNQEYGHVLYQDGDLFALNYDLMTSEELSNFGCDELSEERKKQELIEELKTAYCVTHYKYLGTPYLSGIDADAWVLDMTVHGDYCGGYMQMANYQVLNESHGHILQTRHEGYGSSMLLFQDADLVDATNEELASLVEQLNSLSDYPTLDDELVSKLESEAADEAYESWGRSDFRKALIDGAADDHEQYYEDMEDEQLDELFRTTADAIGEYWHQDGDGLTVYINVDRIAQEALDRSGTSAI